MRVIFATILALLLAMPSFAAFRGDQGGGFVSPGSANTSTVKAAKSMRDDSLVTLTGNIISRISGDKYIFRDATGEITVEIEDKDFRGQTVTPQNTVRISGEVDKEFGQGTEIEVKRLDVLN